MGYRIDYRPVKKVRGAEKKVSRVPALTALCIFLFLLLVNNVWPRGREVLQEILLPGDAVVTAAALEEFSQELQSGEEISIALDNFCRKVIQEAEFAGD